jgi:hypothetical protein
VGCLHEPGVTIEEAEIIIAGDSYMALGSSMTNLVSTELERQTGKVVLNRAFPARGPFYSFSVLLNELPAYSATPKWLVWGFIERELTGASFARYARHLQRPDEPAERAAPSGMQYERLAPEALRESLPNTSALAQLSRKAWRGMSYLVFRELPPEVFFLQSKDPDEASMLGYGYALDSFYWSAEERGLDEAADVVKQVAELFSARNVKLVVMPIPDKEQIYSTWIDASDWQGGSPGESIIPAFLELLQARNIDTVDLLATFREARARGERLYWRDDTHWNDEGIALAAQKIARHMNELEKKSPHE